MNMNTVTNTPYQVTWEREYQRHLKTFLREHHFFDGSMVCKYMRAQGLQDPVHHNMWATQINFYAGQGWMKNIGRTRFPAGEHSHGRDITEWESLLVLAKFKRKTKAKK